jgi:tetratricopeptide (TPR) repeat protein
VLLSYAAVALKLEDYDTAKGVLHESLAIYQRINKQWGVAYALRFLARAAQAEGDLHQAQHLHQHSLVLFQEIDNASGVTLAFSSLGAVSTRLERYQDAQYYYQTALEMALASQATPIILQVLLGMADMLLRRNTAFDARTIQLDQEHFFRSEPATAFLLLTYVLLHPTANQETKAQARTSLVELTTMLPPHLVGALRKRANSQQLQDLVQAVSFAEYL